MSKQKKNKPTAKNVTYERLVGLPFDSAKSWKEAQETVLLQVWRRMEEARVIHEMAKRPEFEFWNKEFSAGFTCGYGEPESKDLVTISSGGEGVRIAINRALAESGPSADLLLEGLVRAMSETFSATYFKSKGFLPTQEKAAGDAPKA